VKVTDDDPALMDNRDRLGHPFHQLHRPRRVIVELGFVTQQCERIPVNECAVQRNPIHEVENQEMVASQREVVTNSRYDVEAGQALKHVPLVRQTNHGI